MWIGDSLSLMEIASITSFLRFGYEYHLYVFDAPKRVPPGTKLMDAEEILPKRMVYRVSGASEHGGGSITSFANIFRWKLLYERGGFWVDTDLILLRPLDFDAEYLLAGEAKSSPLARTFGTLCRAVGLNPPSHAVNCFLKASPQSELMGR
jgi:hypothetical protein